MVIKTTKNFDKQYSKLTVKIKAQYKSRVALFCMNPFVIRLRNHGLKGKYLGYRSFDMSGDVSVLFTIKDNSIVIFAFIRTHSQLY